MSLKIRILLSLAILLVDSAVFFLPLGSGILVYILLARPQWFVEFVTKVYQ